MRYLVQFSGGLESVGMLVAMIDKEPNSIYDLLHVGVHHGVEEFFASQLNSTIKLVRELHEVYPDTEINLLPLAGYALDACNSGDSPYIFAITMLTILNSQEVYDKILCGLINVEDGTDDRNVALALRELFDCPVEICFPFIGESKRSVYEIIPEGLRELASTCRNPLYEDHKFVPCGDCIKCREYVSNGIKLLSVDGKEVESLLQSFKDLEGLWLLS